MATASPSPLASSAETTNGVKLRRLLVDGGTTVLRTVFDGIHPPTKLAANLHLEKNKSTLDDLFAEGFLSAQQRIRLFPSDGSKPDSKTFDISLLFLLLTEMCDLSPPRTGWNHKPHAKDRSIAANLVRIKLFRNDLFHPSKTCIDTRLFNELWKQISGVLVSLGLDQAEINRLKTERCGEEDYLDILFKWADREKDIKLKLEGVCQSQTKMMKAVVEQQKIFQDAKTAVETVCQAQQERQKILQDTKLAVEKAAEKVCQTQQEHCTLLQDANTKLEQAHETQENTKSKLETIHQSAAKTRETVERVYHTQLVDHETLQDNNSKLDNVYQTQVKTQDTVARLRQTQLEDRETLQYSKSTLQALHETQSKAQDMFERFHQIEQEDRETLHKLHDTQSITQQIVQGVVETQEEHFETLQAVKEAIDSLKEGRDPGAEEHVLQNLAKSEFKGDIEYLVGRYQEGTREWVFNEVENWLDDRNSENRVMVISSNAGMGKSVISAVICKRMKEAGRLSGSHFCQHNNARYRNPQLMLQSLACRLYHALPEYKQALVKQLSRNLGKDLNNMGVEGLFALLFKEPLSTVADPGRNMLMVIDGLDESDYQERNELLNVLANHLCKLPCWIRFLCTTRPERNIAEALKHLKPFQLESNDDKNMEDIKCFIENSTGHLIEPEKKGAILEKLVKKSEGLMLYAYFLVLFIEENKSVLDQGNLDDSFPLAISSAYHSYFKRLENELKKEVGVNEEDFLNLLSAVIASREPMPIDFVSKLLGPNASSPLARRKVLKAISSVSSLLPIRDGCLHVIHKSVKDWLTDASCYGEHDFTIDEKDGHRILASLCADELDHLKQKGVRVAQFSATEKYALHHGVRHMLQLNENMGSRNLEKCIRTYVTDLKLLYERISVNSSIAAEEILWLQSHERFRALSANTRDLLNTLIVLLRKHFSTFTDYPQLVFQTSLNEGGPVLSPMASDILQHKYLEIPYLEFVNKKTQHGTALVRFQCSSQVACFDVSPQLDFMVCECTDGTIQLWSLRTGGLLWTRPLKVERRCYYFCLLKNAYRTALSFCDIMSFYRSAVFHPTEKVVLPGVLSHAYDFNGELKPFFPESHCSFTVCSISGDKTTILTDCPDDGKCIIMWSLKNGSEISRTTRDEVVLSFARSRDGKLLAISHASGRIAIVDAVGGFRTLGQTDLRKVCGMIRFSPDSRSLLCLHLSPAGITHCTFRLNIDIAERLTCRMDVLEEHYVTWEFESRSEGGFLLGDPLSCVLEDGVGGIVSYVNFEFVLDKHTVLRRDNNRVEMLNINEQHQHKKEVAYFTVLQIVFSLSGEIIYVTSSGGLFVTVTAWNVSSSELIAEKKFDVSRSSLKCLLAVKGGVLIVRGMCTLQMWNLELSKCVRCWTNIGSVTDVVPISEERVACATLSEERLACVTTERKVIILDTTSEEILSTIQIGLASYLLACNSKFQILTSGGGSLCLSDRKTTLWKKGCYENRLGRFSPAEKFVISLGKRWSVPGIHVLDAVSGNILHVLCRACHPWLVLNCEFFSDEECVVIWKADRLEQSLVQLFKVKSGDLLSNLPLSYLKHIGRQTRNVNCLAASPCKRLVAINQPDTKHGYELIQVRLPGDEDSRKSKW